jgi:hypothetical protein
MDGDDWTSLSINSPSALDRRSTTEIYAPTKVGQPSSPLAVTGNTDYCAVVASNLTDRAPMHSGNPLATIRSWQISSAASERHLNAARFNGETCCGWRPSWGDFVPGASAARRAAHAVNPWSAETAIYAQIFEPPRNLKSRLKLVQSGIRQRGRIARMSPSEKFRKFAQECQAMAKLARSSESKASWSRLAERWIRCAELTERLALASTHHRVAKRHRRASHSASHQHGTAAA